MTDSKKSLEPIQKSRIYDTSVFIDYLRGRATASPFIDDVVDGSIEGIISVITIAELWSGVKDNKDEKRHKILLSRFRKIQCHTAIAQRAGSLAYPFFKRQDKSISLADFIIAATAEFHNADIVTRNPNDFEKIPLQDVKIISYK